MRKRLQETRDRVSSLKGEMKSDSKSEKKSKTDGKVVRSITAVTISDLARLRKMQNLHTKLWVPFYRNVE